MGRSKPGPKIGEKEGKRAADAMYEQEPVAGRGKPGGDPDLGINVDRISTDETLRQETERVARELDKELKEARGYRSWETAEERAAFLRTMGYGPENIGKGKAFESDAHLMAAWEILEQSGRDAQRAAQKLREATAEGGDVAAAQRDLDKTAWKWAWMMSQVARRKAETARAMAAMRHFNTPLTPQERVLRYVAREHGEVTAEFVKAFLQTDPADWGRLQKILRIEFDPGIREKFREYYINGLLSSPATGIANLVGTASSLIAQLARYGIVGSIERLKGDPSRGPSEIFAAMGGLREGAKIAWEVFKDRALTERVFDPIAEGQGLSPFLKNLVGDVNESRLEARLGAIGGKVGYGVRTPGRTLAATDAALKVLSGVMETYFQAHRMGEGIASRRGLKGAARDSFVASRIAEIIADPEAHGLGDAVKKAMDYNTFNQRLGMLGQILTRARDAAPFDFGYVIAPFMRTPTNILKYVLEHSPANFARILAHATKGRKGGEKLRGEALSEELAKPILGTLVGMGFAAMAKEGFLTGGGPTDERERRNLEATGWQPYSLHVGDQYISFKRLQPFASIAGIAADMVEMKDEKKAGDLAQKLIGTIGENILDQSFWQGVDNFYGAWHDPVRFGETWAKRTAGSILVPNILAAGARAVDPTMRQTHLQDGSFVLNRIPFASMMLDPVRRGTGDVVTRPGTAVERFVSPFQRSTEKGPEANLERELGNIDYIPSPPSRTFTIPNSGGKKVYLNRQEFALLQRHDEAMTKRLREAVEDPRYKRLDPEEKRKFIRGRYQMAADDAKRKLLPIVLRRIRSGGVEFAR